MNHKSFLFVGAWMQPLRALPLQLRWNVMEAIVEYSTSGSISTSLDTMETVAFGFIRNEIDRMKHHHNEACMKRHPAANDHHNETCRKRQATACELREKRLPTAMQTGHVKTPEDSDAKACKALHPDAPYDIESVSVSESISESDETTSSTSSGVRARGGFLFRWSEANGQPGLHLNHEQFPSPQVHVIGVSWHHNLIPSKTRVNLAYVS